MPELKLHEYQERAIDEFVRVKTLFSAIDMGLGKTVIKLKAIERLSRPAIVFAPINPMYNTWPNEIKKWGITASYDILHGPNKTQIFNDTKADILLLNYDGLKWFLSQVSNANGRRKFGKRMLILDESSMIKSPKTQRFKSLKKLFPLWDNYRACLSATPSPNGYHDLWTQYYMLDKGKSLLPTYYKYRGAFFNYMGPPVFKTTLRPECKSQIEELIRPITFRLAADDYLKMPELIQNEIPVGLTQKLRKKYDSLERDFLLEFDQHSATAFHAGALSNKLRQFMQGAVYVDDSPGTFYPLHTLKIDALKTIIEASAGQSILCPIQFKFELKMIKEVLKYDVPCVAGKTSAKEARYLITEWNKGNIPLLLCHPASLSHGVNLQSGGHIIVWFGLPWSVEQYKQLTGRLYRQGQKNAVIVHHLLIEDSIDQRVFQVLKRKDATQQGLLNALRR